MEINHQAKWKVTKPDRWNKIISAISNTKILIGDEIR